MSRNPPASINRMLNRTSGSTEYKPNFPAMDADDHSTENMSPVKIYWVNDFSTSAGCWVLKKAVHINYEQLFCKNQIVQKYKFTLS